MTHTDRVRQSRLLAILAIPAALIVLSGCAGAPTGGAPSTESSSSQPESGGDEATAEQGDDEVITIGLEFMPETITVPVGTTVTWTNGETIGHTITSGAWGDVNESTGLRGSQTPDGLFDHKLAAMGSEGDSFSYTFDEAGEFPYYCQPHLTMNAMVIVEG
ncbi:plastocyanin/azurin family copper-binding protein [Microcella daejeonensis]|uniref:cupredoxin domain-containing protein n=1 Tax=Microcella daejeonensis TaxID=2994971 RepID=UPI00227210A2|nr:plastocyanin/azurin family copper-binding protein [Microcella daejeonensis]WAB84146.1 plastocyanin/azurin family copper-binding protein [Microcella daejeonensis]